MTHDKTTFRDLMSESSLSTKWAIQLRPSYCFIIITELIFCELCREELANILYMCSPSCCGSEQLSESFHQSRCRTWAESHATQTTGLHHLQQRGGPVPEILARHPRYTHLLTSIGMVWYVLSGKLICYFFAWLQTNFCFPHHQNQGQRPMSYRLACKILGLYP